MLKSLFFVTIIVCLTSNALRAEERSPAERVYSEVNQSVFMVFDIHNNDFKTPVNYGSSIAIAKNIVATNCHVALQGEKHIVKVQNKLETATLIYKDEKNDLCLLQIPDKNLKPVKLRAAATVKIGETVFTVGSPRGYERSISQGIISNKIKFKNTAILQTDAAISPGSSGGGLFDKKSHLIGITFSKNEAAGTEGIGFAIPAEMISAAVKQLNSHGAIHV